LIEIPTESIQISCVLPSYENPSINSRSPSPQYNHANPRFFSPNRLHKFCGVGSISKLEIERHQSSKSSSSSRSPMAPLIATWNEAYDIDGFGQSCRSFRTAPPSTLGTASTDDSYRALISGYARLGSVSDRDKFGAAYRLAELEENKLQEPERPRSSQDPRSGREVRNPASRRWQE
jgi:hypothetical protein